MPLAPDVTGRDSLLAFVSLDGSTAAFTFRDGPVGCRCEDVWVWRRNGEPLELASVSTSGGEAGQSEAVDISGNGRFVLFHSTSSTIAGGPPDSRGQLFVRDLATDTTAMVPLWTPQNPIPFGDELNAAISDDGDRVVFAAERSLPVNGQPTIGAFPVVYDRSSGAKTLLAQTSTANDYLAFFSALTISGDGRRVAYSTNDLSGNVHHIVADLIGG